MRPSARVSESAATKWARKCPRSLAKAASCHIDLAEANRRQLAEAGVPEPQIYAARLCTRCGGDFHSYRRDKEQAGRMLSFIGIK